MSRHNSKSGLFLMEMIIVILFFSICSAVCVSIFAKARIMADDSRDLNNAVIRSSNIAEIYKAAGGELNKTARLLKNDSDSDLQSAEEEDTGKGEKLTVLYEDMTIMLSVADSLATVTAYDKKNDTDSIFTMHVRA